MKDYTELATEIMNDPESLGYAGKNHREIADLMNQKVFDGEFNATFKTIISHCGIAVCDRLINSMTAAAQNSPSISKIVSLLDNGNGINLGDPIAQQLLDSFAANPSLPLEVSDATTIKNLASNLVSRAEQLNFGDIKEYDIRRALNG